MIDLDDPTLFKEYDPQNMMAEIDGLPDQLKLAWELGQGMPLPDWKGIERVLIVGMGGSAIGADLLNAYAAPLCRVPVLVCRNYDLPAWANGSETLVVASSHSGNTEETLSAFEGALTRDCRGLVICTGGKLAARARETGTPLWRFDHQGQPRAAVGYSFGILLALFVRLGFLPDPQGDIDSAVAAMNAQQEYIRGDVPVTSNPAKRLAGQALNRWVSRLGDLAEGSKFLRKEPLR